MAHEPLIEDLFAFEERVGRGAWGEVLRAKDRRTGAVVAVKRIHKRLDDGDSSERFRREARLLAQVTHPNVVRYVASGVDHEGLPCLVVEWLDGEDLAQRKRRERPSLSAAVEIVRQAALGLAALHDAGIVHRDVKPSNLFLVNDPTGALYVKLIDLGVARSANESTLTVEGSVVGTPFYMAPEQARGQTHLSSAADLFSLGVVLFELLSGQRPFVGDDMFAVLAKIVLQDAPRLRDVWPRAPADLDALLAQCLSRAPEGRYASGRALAAALAALAPLDAEAPPDDLADEAPTARVSVALSPSSEQRVVTAMFAGFAPWAPGDGGSSMLVSLAEEHGASCHPTLDRHIIALFGGERSAGDEAVRAARTALAAAARIRGIRLSIATGKALAQAGGIAGDVIERGASILPKDGDAPLGTARLALPIHLDAPTARLLSEQFVIEDDGRRRLLRAPRQSTPGPRLLVGQPTPCVGRDRELANLEAVFQESVDESLARVMIVTGPTGIGKSRVRHELLTRIAASATEPVVLFARGSPLAAGSAFGLLGPAIRRLAGILDGEPLGILREKLYSLLAPTMGVEAALRTVGPLGEIAGIPREEETRPHVDAALAGELLKRAFVDWLDALTDQSPVVLVLEDAQWGDLPTIRVVDGALYQLANKPIMVLVVARPEVSERFPKLFADRGAQEIRLAPLTPKASERLVREALGDDIDKETLKRVLSRAEGNAFFLEELIRAVAEGAREALPDTVLGVLQARLDALGPEPKRVLRAASIFGQAFWRGAVETLLGGITKQATVVRTLDALTSAEVITRRSAASFPGEEEYTFRHALVRDAAYATLTDSDRAVGHRLAGFWLENAGEADPAILALHFERGDAPDRAAVFHLRAADKALRGNDFGHAIDHAETSRRFAEDAWVRGEARLIAAEAHRWRGELTEAAFSAEEAINLLPQGETPWFHAAREAIAAYGRKGQINDVRRFADRLLLVDPTPTSVGAHIASLVPAAVHLRYVGDATGATAITQRIDALVPRAGQLDPVVLARLHQMHALSSQQQGDLATAVEHHHLAIESFEAVGDRRAACLTSCNLGCAYTELGAYPEAETALARALDAARRMGLSTIVPLALQNLGVVMAFTGRLSAAREVEAESTQAFRELGDPRLENASRTYLAMVAFLAGDLASAETEARRVIVSSGAAAPQRAVASAWLARTLLAADRRNEALEAASEAAALVEQLGGLEELESLVPVALAEALEGTGRRGAARGVLAVAKARLEERAALLGDPATRARFLEGVPHNARCLELARLFGVG